MLEHITNVNLILYMKSFFTPLIIFDTIRPISQYRICVLDSEFLTLRGNTISSVLMYTTSFAKTDKTLVHQSPFSEMIFFHTELIAHTLVDKLGTLVILRAKDCCLLRAED